MPLVEAMQSAILYKVRNHGALTREEILEYIFEQMETALEHLEKIEAIAISPFGKGKSHLDIFHTNIAEP